MADQTELLENILAAIQKGNKATPAGPQRDFGAERKGMTPEQYARSLKDELKTLDVTNVKYRELSENLAALEESQSAAAATSTSFNKEIEAGAQIADTFRDRVLGINGEFQNMTSLIPGSTKQLVGFTKEMLSFNGLVKTAGALLLKLVSNTVNFALATDQAAASFRAATGAGYKYTNVISQAGAAYLTYGINAKDAGDATTALFSSFREFTDLSESQQASIVATTAIMSKFNISSSETGKNLDIATKSLGLNITEATTLIRDFESIADAVGKPISEISKDFASAAPKIAFYGAQAVDVFKQLEAQSKSTGLSVDKLLGTFGEQFDTFEGSAKAVGRLNAIMGGSYLNSIDMLNASESERLEMIQGAIKANGVLFDDLNKFEQKAFASAMGTDVDTLRRSLEELSPFEQRQIKRQEELAAKAGQARDVISKLKDAFNSLIITNQPFVQQIVNLIDKFSKFIQKNHDLTAVFNTHVLPTLKTITGFFKTVMLPAMKFVMDHWRGLLMGMVAFKALVMGFTAAGFIRQLMAMTAATNALAAANATAAATSPGGGAAAAGAARGAGKLLRFGGGGALAAGGLMAAGATYAGIKSAKAQGDQNKAMGVGVLGGAASGALTGAGIGTMIAPGIGTAIGAGVGGVFGGAMGYMSAANDILVTTLNDSDGPMTQNGEVIGFGVPGGPLSRKGTEFNSSRSQSSQIQLEAAVERGIAAGLARANISPTVEIKGDIGKFLDAGLNSPQGQKTLMPFYNR
jgi:hypothetical protein